MPAEIYSKYVKNKKKQTKKTHIMATGGNRMK